MTNEFRIHIKPTDWLMDHDEIADGSEPRARSRLYIMPFGPYELNEVGEANYFKGNTVPYHEHMHGFETFLLDGGAMEIMCRSRKAVAHKGDLVHLMPYQPHAMHALEDNTIWRSFHQGHSLIPNQRAQRRFRDMYPDIFNAPDFDAEDVLRNSKSIRYQYRLPECKEVPVREFPEIRTPEFAYAEFDFDQLNLKLKVGRWETGGAKEVWQLTMKKGCRFSWIPINKFDLLYNIYKGSVEVNLDGMAPIIANTRDLLDIPNFFAGSLTALEDTVLLDMGCQGYLMRYLDEVTALRIREPEKLKDAVFLRQLMKRYDFYTQFTF